MYHAVAMLTCTYSTPLAVTESQVLVNTRYFGRSFSRHSSMDGQCLALGECLILTSSIPIGSRVLGGRTLDGSLRWMGVWFRLIVSATSWRILSISGSRSQLCWLLIVLVAGGGDGDVCFFFLWFFLIGFWFLSGAAVLTLWRNIHSITLHIHTPLCS